MTMRRCIQTLCSLLLLMASLQVTQAGQRWGKDYLPNNPVLTQDGRQVSFYDDVLKGKIAVISFIYTSCRDICPMITARLSQLEEKLGDVVGRDIVFVSVSIDPETDTPAKLKEYSEAFSAGPGWLFLTGKPEDIAVIRHKLGDRRDKLSDHRNEALLYNDATGDWERASTFADLNTLAVTVRNMDPVWRNDPRRAAVDKPAEAVVAKATTDAAHSGHDEPLGGLPGQALFIKTCGSCHTVGKGARVGPDLAGLTTRRTRSWITSYVTGPEKMRAAGDPVALELQNRFRAVRMPNLQLSEDDARDVIGYIEMQTYAAEAEKKDPHAHHHHAHN